MTLEEVWVCTTERQRERAPGLEDGQGPGKGSGTVLGQGQQLNKEQRECLT